MNAKIRKMKKNGVVRMATTGAIKEVLINEDLMHPNAETIAVCFRGDHSSGIIEFTSGEMEKLMNTVKRRMHLIKGMGKETGLR